MKTARHKFLLDGCSDQIIPREQYTSRVYLDEHTQVSTVVHGLSFSLIIRYKGWRNYLHFIGVNNWKVAS